MRRFASVVGVMLLGALVASLCGCGDGGGVVGAGSPEVSGLLPGEPDGEAELPGPLAAEADQTTTITATPRAGSGFRVTATVPVPDSTDAWWTRNVTATFSQAVAPSSLNAASFRLTDGAGHAVTGKVAYASLTRTASFRPSSPFRPGERYRAVITTAVRSAGGARLSANHSWSFTTRLPAQQRLHVAGNQIQDELGRRVVLRGVNVVDPGYTLYQHHWKASYFDAMQSWGVKAVRIPIHPAPFRWYERNDPGSYLRLLDWGVAWAGERGMYCILDFHSIGYPPTGEYDTGISDTNWGEIYSFTVPGLRSFWHRVSQHFANDPRIALYDIYNEPRTGPDGVTASRQAWLRWRDLAEALVDGIRANDPDRLVLVGGLQWSYDVSFAGRDPVRRPNVVYSAHVYPWSVTTSGWHKNWNGAFGNLALTAPVLVGETGFDPNSPPDSPDRGTTRNYAVPLIDGFLGPRQIGWIAWCFSPDWDPTLVSDWSFTPTISGSFYRQRLLAQSGS